MAAHGASEGGIELGSAAPVDYNVHERTYRGFLKLFKYGLMGIAIVLALMALFLT